MDMTKVLSWAINNGFSASDVLANPSHFKAEYISAHTSGGGKKKPAKFYNTVLLLRPEPENGSERAPIALPPMEAKRGKGAKGELLLAIHAALLIHKLTPDDVVSIVRSPVQSFEEFFSNDDAE